MPGSEEVSVFLNISFNVSFIFQALPLNVDIMGTVISRFLNPEKGNLEQKRVVVFFFLMWLKQAEAMDLERNTDRVMAF